MPTTSHLGVPVMLVHKIAMAHDQDAADVRIAIGHLVLDLRQSCRIDSMI